MRLLERDAQLAALAEYARDAAAGGGRLVLVSGEAGIGKSALLETLQSQLPDALWYWGACDGLFVPRPLGPLLDIADHLGGPLLERCRTGAPRDQLFAAFLSELAGFDRLAVFVLEDVHWADDATLDLLRFLARRVRDTRALLLVTYRDDGVAADDPLRVALGEVTTRATTRRLTLPALSERAVEQLTDGTGLAAGEVFRLTEGNPFYLAEILRHGLGDLPVSARDAVLAQVAVLSPRARGVLDVAALVGTRVEPDLLDAVSGGAPEAVDELVSRGLLVGEADRLRFRHEIARLAIDQAVPVHRRTRVHRDVLAALLAQGCDDDARLAFHAEGAGDVARVLQHAPAAGRRASAVSAHREAIAQYERALRVQGSTDARTRAELYEALAQECSLVDRWQEAADARQVALEHWRAAGDRLREGDTLRALSRTMWRLCRGDEERAAIEASLCVLEPLGPTPELARTYVYLAGIRMTDADETAAIAFADRALELADRLDLPDVTSDALNTKACCLAGSEGTSWDALLNRALEVAVEAGLSEQVGRAYANLYEMYCGWLLLTEGERYFVDGVAYCDEHDISTFGTCLRGGRTAALNRMGRLAEATEIAERLLARTSASLVNRLNPLASLGRARARAGAPGVWECLDEGALLAERLGEGSWVFLERLARAEAAWLEGDAELAAREVLLAEAAAPGYGASGVGEALVWRQRIAATPGGPLLPPPVVPAAGVPEPFASQLSGEHLAAAAWLDSKGCRFDAALALLDAGDEESVREALERFELSGALAAARRARQRLRDLGVGAVPSGARPATREHPAGLTPRQREVLELICAGRTNGEISDRLFISTKTVDHHVSAVLGKLGVHSRQRAADEAVRRGLVPARVAVPQDG